MLEGTLAFGWEVGCSYESLGLCRGADHGHDESLGTRVKRTLDEVIEVVRYANERDT